jgi:small-conductance mechanosensitive channel
MSNAIMLNPPIIGLIVFAVVLAGAFAGWALRQRLPAHHLGDETKNLVSVSMAVVATISALVLGLLIANANASFSARGGEVTALSAQILRLDQILRRYGPETGEARETLRQYAELKTGDLFPDNPQDLRLDDQSTYELLQRLEDSLLALKPTNSRDQWWLGQALTLAGKIGDTRWLLAQQVGQGTPKAFVALLVFWLTILFASFGLFAPPNLTSAITLTLCAIAVAGAIGMILELEGGFAGVIHISPQPMRQAVAALQAEAHSEVYE